MLRRIAYVGKDKAQYKRLVRAAKDAQVQVISVDVEGIPPSVTAIVADGESAAPALKAALAMGECNEELLRLIAEAVDCREGFSEGASVRVMEHATRFAVAIGLSPEDRLTLERGALVRDIGKIRIPNRVLLKEGVLTYDEWRMLQEHPHLGAEIVAKTRALKDVCDIVRNHHECYDGDGYPEALEGESIPYLARIMKLLDVYCAMTSPRHYRKGHSTHEEAIEYLRSEQGKHFDPQLVDVFINAEVGVTAARGPGGKGRSRKKAKIA